ncbi:E3 ubiquitin-protein ligase TRIM39-like [Gavia stellata]|uniref:E3 ubiquitin-protein ligase TRIM39-like n=1 Tax=Gavia stellata TaxID=37040 RepID=UPI00289B9888|nr:E3 ubiquitin-protein ligase TRIM39-like [Gavia stellata]
MPSVLPAPSGREGRQGQGADGWRQGWERPAEPLKQLCQEHQEALERFCVEDQSPVCRHCAESQAHRAHATVPLEEAAAEYKTKLEAAVKLLQQQKAEAWRLKSQEEEKLAEWKNKTSRESEKINKEFEKLHSFLDEEEEELQRRLKRETKDTATKLRSNVAQMTKQSQALDDLIDEINKRCQQPALGLLKDMESLLNRSETIRALKPAALPTELRGAYDVPTGGIFQFLNRFKAQKTSEKPGLEAPSQGVAKASSSQSGVRSSGSPHLAVLEVGAGQQIAPSHPSSDLLLLFLPVDVTLDPTSAHPSLLLSEDGRSVSHGGARQDLPDHPERFDPYVFVLGSPRIASGRCYWEVEVGDKTEWDIGVCREAVKRKGKGPLSPLAGFWRMWLRNSNQYKVLLTHPITLSVRAKPRRVGIYLDYKGGEVTFYNATDQTHLYTYSGVFAGVLRPFFSPGLSQGGSNTEPLVVRPAAEQG